VRLLLPACITRQVGDEILKFIREADLGEQLEDALIKALSGPTRVLPEGKTNLCAALTFLAYSSAAREESLRVTPAIVAMEMLLAASDVIDDIEDDEADHPSDRFSMGRTLKAVSSLLMLSHEAVGQLNERGMPAGRVVKALRVFDTLGVDALRGQIRDLELEGRSDVTLEESLNASRLKAASLVRCAAELGACLGTDDENEVGLYAQYGWHLGLAIQLMNDVAAVWPGGPDKSDIRLRKKTLPVAYALSVPGNSNSSANIVRSYYCAETGQSISEDAVKLALWHCGAIHYTWIVAAREKARALAIGRTLSERTSSGWAVAGLLN
jgi:geranylgeranyl pyrophosphate synthase